MGTVRRCRDAGFQNILNNLPHRCSSRNFAFIIAILQVVSITRRIISSFDIFIVRSWGIIAIALREILRLFIPNPNLIAIWYYNNTGILFYIFEMKCSKPNTAYRIRLLLEWAHRERHYYYSYYLRLWWEEESSL